LWASPFALAILTFVAMRVRGRVSLAVIAAVLMLSGAAVAVIQFASERWSAAPNPRAHFVDRLLDAQRRGTRDARSAVAAGKYSFVGGNYTETEEQARLPGFDLCHDRSNPLTVTDWAGDDQMMMDEDVRGVYGEAYNQEVYRLHPQALEQNCALKPDHSLPRLLAPDETQLHRYQTNGPSM
jgi:hypothetical protein